MPLYVDDIKNKFIEIQRRRIEQEIEEEQEYAKNKVKEMYNEKERNV